MLGLAEGLGRFMGGVQGPLMGYCTDRFGPRVMLAFGGLMSGLGFILLARTTNFWWFLLVFVIVLSVGFRSGYNNASIAAVNNWFRRRRGLAMSVVSMGNGLGGASAYLVGLLVFLVGWRDACTILGFAVLAVVIPLSYFFASRPRGYGSAAGRGRARTGRREPVRPECSCAPTVNQRRGYRLHRSRGDANSVVLAAGHVNRFPQHRSRRRVVPDGAADHMVH
jgi:MFS family permease